MAKLFYFCQLKELVRPETFGPTLVACWRQRVRFVCQWNCLFEQTDTLVKARNMCQV